MRRAEGTRKIGGRKGQEQEQTRGGRGEGRGEERGGERGEGRGEERGGRRPLCRPSRSLCCNLVTTAQYAVSR
jgi:hypothetical protein